MLKRRDIISLVSTCLWKLFWQKNFGTSCETGTRHFLYVHLKNHPLCEKRKKKKETLYILYHIKGHLNRPFAASYSCGTKRNRHDGEQRTHWDVTNGCFLCLSCPIDLLQLDLS